MYSTANDLTADGSVGFLPKTPIQGETSLSRGDITFKGRHHFEGPETLPLNP